MDKNELGSNIRQKRKELGMTQDGLALQLGCHRTSVANIEHGSTNLISPKLYDIASALGTSEIELIAPGVFSSVLADGDKTRFESFIKNIDKFEALEKENQSLKEQNRIKDETIERYRMLTKYQEELLSVYGEHRAFQDENSL